MKKLRRTKNQRVRKVMITVDTITDAVVKALAERENHTYSGTICAMATSAALKDPGLLKVINDVVKGATVLRLAEKGWHPGLSRALAIEMVEGTEETLTWN